MATANPDGPRGTVSPVCEIHHDLSGDVRISASIIEAVATADGVDPTDSDLKLYEAVDLEALDGLFEHRSVGDHWRFEFEIDEFVVVIEGEGRVAVYEGR